MRSWKYLSKECTCSCEVILLSMPTIPAAHIASVCGQDRTQSWMDMMGKIVMRLCQIAKRVHFFAWLVTRTSRPGALLATRAAGHGPWSFSVRLTPSQRNTLTKINNTKGFRCRHERAFYPQHKCRTGRAGRTWSIPLRTNVLPPRGRLWITPAASWQCASWPAYSERPRPRRCRHRDDTARVHCATPDLTPPSDTTSATHPPAPAFA